jgi:hypothetical protein
VERYRQMGKDHLVEREDGKPHGRGILAPPHSAGNRAMAAAGRRHSWSANVVSIWARCNLPE